MRIAIVLTALVVTATAGAAETMKPGLWEMTMKSDQLKNVQMPEIPPAQLEQMRKMGIQMPQVRDGAITQKVCITQEMAERQKTPGAPRESDCKLKSQDRSGNSFRAEVVCDGPNLKGTGSIKGTYASNTQFNSTYDFNGTMQGQPVTQHHETSGQWLSADCGSVRPIGASHQ